MTKAVIDLEIWVLCPHCRHKYNATYYDGGHEIIDVFCSNSWVDLDIDALCPKCCRYFTIDRMERC